MHNYIFPNFYVQGIFRYTDGEISGDTTEQISWRLSIVLLLFIYIVLSKHLQSKMIASVL